MRRLVLLPLLLLFAGVSAVNAQEPWSLLRCVEYARQNGLAVKRAEIAVKTAALTEQQSRAERLPSLDGTVNANLRFGRSINPTTNTFNTETFGSNSFSLNSSVVLYSGGRITNTIEQARVDARAAQADAEVTANDLGLSIANAYLQILLSEEQLAAAQKRLEQSQAQLIRMDKLIQAGVRPENERLDLLASVAREQQTIVAAQNLVETNYLNLRQLLELDPAAPFRIERPVISIPNDADPFVLQMEAIYQQALSSQPQIRAGELRMESAGLGVEIAKSGLLPTVGIGAGLSSNYASIVQDFNNPNLSNAVLKANDPVNVLINGENATLTTFSVTGVSFPKRPYFDQLSDNFGYGAGLSINVPIYNNRRTRTNIDRAELAILQQQIANKQTMQLLKSDVQRAVAEAKAAKLSLDAAQSAFNANQVALENAIKRFELGAINSFDLTTAQNNQAAAEVEVIRSRFQYLFNLKVLDFYMGRPIKLD